MKKLIYSAPDAELIYVSSADILMLSTVDGDGTGEDINWDDWT